MDDIKSTMCDLNVLYESYLKTIRSSKWKETTQKFILNYLRNIIKLSSDLENMVYKSEKEREFTLSERGKIRPITTLHPKDRLVRHALCDEILMPKVIRKIIYDNGSSVKGRGVAFTRKRFEVHMHKAYCEYGTNEIYVLFVDFRKFYDNIRHDIAKKQLLNLCDNDLYLEWLLDLIFKNFQIDMSHLSEESFDKCMDTIFDKNEYRKLNKKNFDGTKIMKKSVNIGDQISQVIGIYYPNRIDTYVKYVKSKKFFSRFMDDFYIFSNSKEELEDILKNISSIANELGIFINEKKTRISRLDRWNRFLQISYRLTKSGKIEKRINPKRIASMRSKLKKLCNKMRNNEKISYESIENTFKSWMCGHYKIMSKVQRKNMILLFEDLYDKKVEIRKITGKWKMIITERG